MHRRSLRVLALAVPTLLALTASAALAAWPHDPTVNVPLSVGTGSRQNQVAVADGSGGMILAWEDFRSGTSRIYAQHVQADGTIAAGWNANGNEVKNNFPTRALNVPAICSDGAGGAIIAWRETFSVTDRDIYAQRMSASGAQVWGPGGAAVAASTYDQDAPRLASDGAGNALVVWQEDHSGDGVPTGFDLYANRIGPNGANRWGTDGVIVCSATGDQVFPAIASDGAGGVDVAWTDKRGPGQGIFASRRDSSSVLHSGWGANGNSVFNGGTAVSAPAVVGNSSGGLLIVWADDRDGGGTQDLFAQSLLGNSFPVGVINGSAVSNALGTQTLPVLAPDGADGAFVAWADSRNGAVDVFAERVTSSATIAPGWPAASVGLPVYSAAGSQVANGIVSDGAGGCILAMFDNSQVRGDIYAAHLTSSGGIAEGWSAQVPVSTAISDQFTPLCVSDGAAGAILAWQDTRNGNSYDLYAQRIDKWGKLGNAEPAGVAVKDVPNDQGGSVRVSWNASYLDAYPSYSVGSYSVWRQISASLALAALRSGSARMLASGDTPDPSRGRALRTTTFGTQSTFWEFVASQTADGLSSYSYVAATPSDSTALGNAQTLFMVEARGSGHQSWDSAPSSGYSVDNLPPPAPAPFAASYSGGATHLHWSPPFAPDLAGFRLYRGVVPGFVPTPGNRIGTPTDTTFADTPGGFYYYRVSAVDVHGNESPTTLAFPAGTTGVADAPVALSLGGAYPNPLRDGATIRWSQPRAEAVRVTLVDLAGRRVRSLLDGVEPAGTHVTRWDARDDGGRSVADGMYFVILEAEGRALRSRIAVVR